jgi:hypothetical protein
LTVFRSKLETELGEEAVQQVEAWAQRSVMDKYGVYTNFRAEGETDGDLSIIEGGQDDESGYAYRQ